MRHLSPETLARLVEEPASPEEQEHLRSCSRCAAELRAFREQTEALSSLPEVRPPSGKWEELEGRLRKEGLIRERKSRRSGVASVVSPGGWLQAAAGLVLFLGGAGVGALATGEDDPAPAARQTAPANAEAEVAVSRARTLEDAAEVLRDAEERYMNALVQYHDLLEESGDDGGATDAASRFAALETLVAAGQAAIREAPTDPFLNGVLASTMAERQAVLRRMSTSGEDDWF